MSYLWKICLIVVVVLGATETAKRFPAAGALINAMPLMSLIVMSLLYWDTGDAKKVAAYALAVPPLVIPSLAFFYLFAFLIDRELGFAMAITLALVVMLAGYGAYFFFIARNG
jgi:hypothetical protein